MGPKVYVTQFSQKLNYSSAQQFGEVVFLTDKEYRAEPTLAAHNDNIVVEMETNFDLYNAGTDYILLTGSPMASVLLGVLLQGEGTHKLLKWNNVTKNYELVILRLGDWNER